jgi:hypothetical protein
LVLCRCGEKGRKRRWNGIVRTIKRSVWVGETAVIHWFDRRKLVVKLGRSFVILNWFTIVRLRNYKFL